VRPRLLTVCVFVLSILLVPLGVAGPATAATAQIAKARVVVSPLPGRIVRSHLVTVRVSAGSHPAAIRARLNGVAIGDQFGERRRGLRSMSASASDGLRRGRNVLRVTTRRLDGRTRTTTVRFTVRTARPLVGAGQNRRVAVGARINLAGIVRQAGLRGARRSAAWKLRSAPRRSSRARAAATTPPPAVTGPAGPPAAIASPAGTTARFTPTTPGTYTLAFTSGSGQDATTDRVTLTAVPRQQLVPIDTRPADTRLPKIKIGETTYDPVPTSVTGPVTLVVVLDRKTLAGPDGRSSPAVTWYGRGQRAQLTAYLKSLSSNDLVVTSVGVGGNGFDPHDSTPLAPIGVATSNAQHVFFSAIGVSGWSPGEADEIGGDPIGLEGYLMSDEYGKYGFTPSDRHVFSVPPAPAAPACAPASCDPSNGFLVDFYDRYTNARLNGGFYDTNGRTLSAAQQTAEALRMANDLQFLGPDTVVKIQAVTNQAEGEPGTRAPVGPITGDAMAQLAAQVADSGGTLDAFNRAAVATGAPAAGGQGYVLLGWKGAGQGHGIEAASGLDGAPVATTISGVLRPDRQSKLRPTAGGAAENALTERFMQAPSQDWQCGPGVSCKDAPRVLAAMSYIGTTLIPALGPDPRALYGIAIFSSADLTATGNELRNEQKFKVPSGLPFAQADFDAAVDQLLTENGWMQNLTAYLQDLTSPFRPTSGNYLDIKTTADTVFKETRAEPSGEVTAHWLEFTKIMLGLAGHLTAGATSVVAELIDLGQWIAGAEKDGSPTYDELSIRADELSQTVAKQGAQVDTEVNVVMRNVIFSDPAKLAYWGKWANCVRTVPGCPPGLSSQVATEQASTKRNFSLGVQSLAYQELLPLGYNTYRLNREITSGLHANKNQHHGPWPAEPRPNVKDYICVDDFGSSSEVRSFERFPANATATLVGGVDPSLLGSPGGGWYYDVYAIGLPLGGKIIGHATPPDQPILKKMFGSVDPDKPEDGGLGISPAAFMSDAPPRFWPDKERSPLECFWGA